LQARGFLRPGVRAVAVPNNRVGAIRVRVAGREPDGGVRPEDLPGVLDDLTAELLALEQPGTGERIVARVVRTADAFGPERHPDLPDLLVVFRRDLGELVAAVGPRVGTVARGLQRPDLSRTGDHTDAAALWCAGPATGVIPAGEPSHLDLAPAILAMLEVPG
jgi:predicted AlkP superfamily phosphohydrolase/phosphomutase